MCYIVEFMIVYSLIYIYPLLEFKSAYKILIFWNPLFI